MAGFVPKGKMSKKAQKELNRQRRVTWDISPVTKTVESKKAYNRRKNARGRLDEYGAGVFVCFFSVRVAWLPVLFSGESLPRRYSLP